MLIQVLEAMGFVVGVTLLLSVVAWWRSEKTIDSCPLCEHSDGGEP